MIDAKISEVFLDFPEKGERKVWIYVPQHEEDSLLPVIYMTDGQNLFYEDSTPHGSWGVIEAIENEIKLSGKSAIVVGIDNGNMYRDNELTPKTIGEVHHRGYFRDDFTPQGEIFDSFLMSVVVPYVEENYPVLRERSATAVCGSSSGGLQAFFEGVEHSDKFSIIGAFSPAFLLYTREDLQKYLAEKMCEDMPYLYLFSGAGDELEALIFESTEMMYELLPEMGYPYDKMCEILLLEKQHNEKTWKEIFPDFLHTFLAQN